MKYNTFVDLYIIPYDVVLILSRLMFFFKGVPKIEVKMLKIVQNPGVLGLSTIFKGQTQNVTLLSNSPLILPLHGGALRSLFFRPYFSESHILYLKSHIIFNHISFIFILHMSCTSIPI